MLDDNLSLVEIAKKVTGDKNVKVIQTDMHQYMNVIVVKKRLKKLYKH